MAGTIRALLRLNIGHTRNLLLRSCPAIASTPSLALTSRLLFTDSALGMVGYESTRMNFRNQFVNVEEAFRVKMREILANPESMVFTEDMKAILHLSQKNDEDLTLIRNMLVRYNSQNSELRFGRYVFGPVVMRTYYFLDEPQRALDLFLDPELKNMFNHVSAQQILMMLLYKHEMYSDMKKVFDVAMEANESQPNYVPPFMATLMAACLKQNTPESLEFALEKFRECNTRSTVVSRQIINILSVLCLKQNKPEIALEVASNFRDPYVNEAKSIRTLCYIQMKRYSDIIPLLRLMIDNVNSQQRRMYGVFLDVPTLLEDNKEEWCEQYPTLSELLQQLRAFELILPKTLEEYSLAAYDTRRRPRVQGEGNDRQDREGWFNRGDRMNRSERGGRFDRFDRRESSSRNFQQFDQRGRQDRGWGEARRSKF